LEQRVIDAGKSVLQALETAGHSAYFVGGYVRDTLLKRAVHDLDVATSARPEEVVRLFDKVIPTGLAHGTVTVVAGGVPIEVTTYRTETGYQDHRRPDQVFFVRSIEQDLARRDFTVNAMALSLRGEIIDPYGGTEDLRRGIIRAVGEAEARFQEDALRMLRCLRFACQLGFTIEERTLSAIKRQAQSIKYIAVERINAEWRKALDSSRPDRAVSLVCETGLLLYLTGLNRLLADGGCEKEAMLPLSRLSTLVERWAYLFVARGKQEKVEPVLRELRNEKAFIRACAETVALVNVFCQSPDDSKLQLMMLEYGFEKVARAYAVYAVRSGEEPLAVKPGKLYEKMEIKKMDELSINGADLQKALERKPGPWVRYLLLRLAHDVNAGQILNEPHALLSRARAVVDEYT
jgi:tRNA nucleotidyltransferase (CCA-adding enzyme)